MNSLTDEKSGLTLYRLDTHFDSRGITSRLWNNAIFPEAQYSLYVRNPKKNTFRGFHYQKEPYEEIKLVICLSGRISDYALNLETKKIFEFDLGPDCDYQAIKIPHNFAHGYFTLEDNSNLLYFIDKPYSIGNTNGINYRDPAISFSLPGTSILISAKDAGFPFI